MEAKVFNFVFSLVQTEEFSLSCFSKLFNETRNDTGQKTKKEKVKQALYGPWEYQEAEDPRFQDNQHMKVVGLSALCTGCLYHTGNIPGIHFC